MVSFPGVEGARRDEDRAVPLAGLDFARDRRDDAVAQLVHHLERGADIAAEVVGPRRSATCGSAKARPVTVSCPLLAPDGAADDVVDVEKPAASSGDVPRRCSVKTVPSAMTRGCVTSQAA